MARLPVAVRRRQLVEAALAVAVREGVEALTVRRVAHEAGVSLGVVHYCFTTKQELLEQVAGAILEANAEAASAALQPHSDLGQALRDSLRGLWSVLEATPGHQLLSYEFTTHALRQPDMRALAQRQYADSRARAEAVLVEVARVAGASWLVPPSQLAHRVLAVCDGVTLAWLVDGDSEAALAALDAFAGDLLRHAQTRPATAGTTLTASG